MSKLFSELKVKDLILKNRIVMAPMCMYEASTDGFPSLFHTIHYANRAMGGVGLIIVEATAIEPRGRISPNDLGLWSDEHIEPLSHLVKEIKRYGAKVGIQLGHAGRKCGVKNENLISPSSIQFSEKYPLPKEMTKEDITTVIDAFKNATLRAYKAGFDIIEIHAAHGYLINQFLSPLTNTRHDEYGGNIKNRTRFLHEIIQAIKDVWPNEKPLMIRISAEDFKEGGNHVEDLIEIIKLIKEDIDIVDVSTGGVVSDAIINTYPGYQITYAEKIRQATNLLTIAGGLIENAYMAEEIISNNRSDLVFLGRELLRNPYFPLQAAQKLQVEVEWPKPYIRSKKY